MKIKEMYYESYDKLLDALKPNGELNKKLHYSTYLKSLYVYRGESKERDLLPTILRNNKETKDFLLANTGIQNLNDDTEEMYWNAEYKLLSDFYRSANSNGLKLPNSLFQGSDYTLNYSFQDFLKISYNTEWLPPNLAELAALAQHYGVPTRLIDWTFDFNVALYFASSGAIKRIAKNDDNENSKYFEDKMVIWLLAAPLIDEAKLFNTENKDFSLRFVVPNYHDNPNLCAQKGVLTYWKIKNTGKHDAKVNRKPLNKLIEDSGYNITSPDREIMYKITIPVRESLSIIKHLYFMGYGAARIFPSFYGSEKESQEIALISKVEGILH